MKLVSIAMVAMVNENIPSPKNILYPIFLKLPVDNIARLKFTLESYDELGILRTLDAERGVVVVLSLHDNAETVEIILREIETDLQIVRIERPDNLDGDWLLSSHEDDLAN